MKQAKFLHFALFVFSLILGIETGAAIFVTSVVFPVWASSPEAAINFVPANPYYIEEGDVFMFTSSISLIASIAVLIAGWKTVQPLRFWTRLASILFIVIFIWSVIYFIPIQDTTFKGEAGKKIPAEELASGLKLFVNLNYVRLAMVIACFVMGLHALGLSYRMKYPEGVKQIN